MAFSENLNNNSKFINCLRKSVHHRTNEVSLKNYFVVKLVWYLYKMCDMHRSCA